MGTSTSSSTPFSSTSRPKPSKRLSDLLERADGILNDPRLCLDIAADVLQCPLPWILSHPEAEPSDIVAEAFLRAVHRVAEGHPLQYSTGRVRFCGLTLDVDDSVLIPRPETELLVEEILRLPLPEKPRVLDVGTGSGAIAAALKHHRPDWRVEAGDVSMEALHTAGCNFQKLNLSIPRFAAWVLSGAKGPWSVVVSNPPYIATQDLGGLPPQVRKEPRLALDGGRDGIELIATLIRQAPQVLARDGWLCLEIGFDQAGKVLGLARRLGYRRIRIINDHAGIPRIFIGQW